MFTVVRSGLSTDFFYISKFNFCVNILKISSSQFTNCIKYTSVDDNDREV